MGRPSSSPLSLRLLLFLLPVVLFHGHLAGAAGTTDGSEQWGYVEVRPKAHMFWWLYRSPGRIDGGGSTPWPVILWLQGGPGASGVGLGNFQEIGPLDVDLRPRNSTWLQKADLLFVDNPVGTGFSYVEDPKAALVKTDEEAAADLTALLKELSGGDEQLGRSGPLYIVAESYGGKYAVTLALSIVKAVQAGELELHLGGVVLGDSWISAEDFVFSWGPLLNDVSRLDDRGLEKSNSMAEKIRQQIQRGQYGEATKSWGKLETFIDDSSNSVDFYNFLLDASMDPLSLSTPPARRRRRRRGMGTRSYSRYLGSRVSSAGDLAGLMNGAVREKLKIIPEDVRWQDESDPVFDALRNDFMKPRIAEVDELLSGGVDVTIYNGQLDLICATRGAEAWVRKLKWEGRKNFTRSKRSPLYCGGGDGATKGFTRSYRNLHFYWILGAGHFVPVDQPCAALEMLAAIVRSPAAAAAAGWSTGASSTVEERSIKQQERPAVWNN